MFAILHIIAVKQMTASQREFTASTHHSSCCLRTTVTSTHLDRCNTHLVDRWAVTSWDHCRDLPTTFSPTVFISLMFTCRRRPHHHIHGISDWVIFVRSEFLSVRELSFP